jgi:hypothetical protein
MSPGAVARVLESLDRWSFDTLVISERQAGDIQAFSMRSAQILCTNRNMTSKPVVLIGTAVLQVNPKAHSFRRSDLKRFRHTDLTIYLLCLKISYATSSGM